MFEGTQPRRLGRLATMAVAALATIAAAVPAGADVVTNDVAIGGGSGGQTTIAADGVARISYWIKVTGNTCDAADGSAAVITIDAPAGATATPSTLTFTACDAPKAVEFRGTPGTHEIPVVNVVDASGTYNVAATAFRLIVQAPVATNAAPVVDAAAADAFGQEGQTLSTSGRFSDPDGDPLTLAASGPGTFVAGTDGSWTWSLATTDDVDLGEVTVTATDPDGAAVADSFFLQASNVAPALDTPSVSGDVAGCRPTLGFGFSDPGTGDTHSGVVEWGDGTSDAFTTSPVSVAHAFHAAGTYSALIRVADDDGGEDTATVAHRVHNIPSGVLQPINGTGARSAFKLGSTIPVKITVADCDGASVGTLAPQVSVVRLDATPDGTIVEATSTATPTTGTTMRYDAVGGQYIYNLATKPLSVGDWRVRLTDPTFAGPVEATFSIRR